MTLMQDAQEWQLCLTDASGASRSVPAQKAGALIPENVAAALQAVLLLGVSLDDASLADVLRTAAPRARRELVRREGVNFVLDVAHNPAAVGKLLDYAGNLPRTGRRIAVFSAMRDKDIKGMLEPAAAHFDAWFLADQPRNDRAAAAADIALVLREAGVTMLSCSKNLKQAMARVQQIVGPGDSVFVFGSFYTVAEVLPIMQRADRLKEAQ
ncbi:MAG: cyanophycin synthetase [Halioglobus sp.]